MARNRVFLSVLAFLLTCSAVEAATPDLRKVPVGFQFYTSRGFSFSLVHRSPTGKETWRDEKAGILWGDSLAERVSRKDSVAQCKKSKDGEPVPGHQIDELPGLADFRLAEEHGFREVLPNMADHHFWVKSTVPGAANIGHVFSGNLGKPILVVYRSINFENTRCIGREIH